MAPSHDDPIYIAAPTPPPRHQGSTSIDDQHPVFSNKDSLGVIQDLCVKQWWYQKMILHWQCIIKASVVNGHLWNSNSISAQDFLLNSSVEYDPKLKGCQSADICLSSAVGYLGMRSSQKVKFRRLERVT